MKYNLHYIHLINSETMETKEIFWMSASREHLIKEINTIAKCYNNHGYDIDKIKIFDADRKLVVSYDL